MKTIKHDGNMDDLAKERVLKWEHSAMEDLQGHPNILKPLELKLMGETTASDIDSSTGPQCSYLLTEYCANETLMSFIKSSWILDERVICFQFLQITDAVHFIHRQGYAHMDLKVNNILLDEFFNIRVGDFGSALQMGTSKTTNKWRGTPHFMAPEVKNHTDKTKRFNPQKADVYSLGVCLFVLLFKNYPKFKEGPLDDFCPFIMSEQRWNSRSAHVKHLLKRMLDPDPKKRADIFEVWNHEWLLSLQPGVE